MQTINQQKPNLNMTMIVPTTTITRRTTIQKMTKMIAMILVISLVINPVTKTKKIKFLVVFHQMCIAL